MQGPSQSSNQTTTKDFSNDHTPINLSTPEVSNTPSVDSTSDMPPGKDFSEKVPFSQIWQDALLPYLGTRLVLVVVGLLATYYMMPLVVSNPILADHATNMPFPQSLWMMWKHFDSGFYISIAQFNYVKATPEMLHVRTNWVFYPFYPMLISGLGKLFGGSETALNISGVVISNIAGLIFISYLYLLVRKEWNQRVARRTVLYLALFPTAIFLSGIYTEALLLGFSVACLYYARKQQWWLAGLLGGLATFTRLQGIVMAVPLAWEYLRVVSERYAPQPDEQPQKLLERARLWLRYYFRGIALAAHDLKNWLNGLAIFLVPCGLLLFMIYGQLYIGDFMATFHASSWGWGRQISPPWRLLIYSLRNPILGDPLNWNFWVVNIVASFAFLGAVIWAFRRLPISYALYTAAAVLLPLSANLLNSTIRYYLLAFPAFILLAIYTTKEERQPLHNFIVAAFASIQSICMVFFVIGLPIMA